MSDAYLAIGDTSLTGALNLQDGTSYLILGQPLSLGGSTAPAGVNFGALERGVVRGPTTTQGASAGTPIAPTGSRPVTIGLMVKGASFDAVEDNYNAVQRYLERARLASGPYAQGDFCCLRYKADAAATNPVYWDVLGGALTPLYDGIPDGRLVKFAVLRLDCMPYSHGAAVTDGASSTLTNGAAASVVYRTGVLGTVESLITTTLKDVSTGLATVTGLVLSVSGTSTYGAGTKFYRVAAAGSMSLGYNVPCAEVSITITSGQGIHVAWNAVAGATNYAVYGTASGAEVLLATTGGATFFNDDGTRLAGTAMSVSDASAPRIVRFTLGHMARLPSMASTDFSGIFKLTAVSPGAASTDTEGNYTGANFARQTPTSAWRTLGETAQPGTGVYQHDYFHGKLRLRDASAPLRAVSTPSVTAISTTGNLYNGTYSAYLTTKDAGGNESLPVALPPAIIPINIGVFYANASESLGGDFSGWAAQKLTSFGTVGANASAAVVADTAAAYTLGGDTAGFRCTSSAGLATWIYQAGFSGNTASIRGKIRINTNSVTTPGTASWTGIPLLLDGSGNWLIGLVNENAGWKIATLAGATAATSGAQIQLSDGGQEQTLEVTFVWNGSTSYTVTAYINDMQAVQTTITGTAGTTAPSYLAVGAATATSTSSLQLDWAEVQMASAHIGAPTGRATWAWTAAAGPNGTGYNLYVQRNGGQWWRIGVSGLGTASYALTTLGGATLGGGPPTGLPAIQPALFRIGVAPNTTASLPDAAYVWSRPFSGAVFNSLWETARFGPIPLPPAVRQQAQANGSEDAWHLRLQVLSNSTSPATVDADCFWLFPHAGTDDLCTVEVPGDTLAAAGAFRVDRRFDDEMSADILDAATGTIIIGQARVRARWSFGPGDNLIVSECEVANPLVAGGRPCSDVLNAKYTTQHTFRPRFDHARGVTY